MTGRTENVTRPDEARRYRRAAVIAAVLLALATTGVFVKDNPFASGYRIKADLASATQLKPGSEVRIAGLRVGKVTGIEASPDDGSIVTLEIDRAGRPVGEDAEVVVRPRLVLEGNAYVDLSPGTPGAPELPSGATIDRSETAIAVQLDQVLDVFDLPTRGSLHRSIGELAEGLGNGGDDRVESGSRGLRRSLRELDQALPPVADVARAARGEEPGDLPRAVGSSSEVAAQVATDPRALADLVTSFNRFTGALAAQDAALAGSIRGFDLVLAAAPPALTELDAALPKLTTLADRLRPTLQTAPAALRETSALLDQIEAISGPTELERLVGRLGPVTARLPNLERRLGTLFGYTRRVTDCVSSNIVPALNMEIEDGKNSTGDPVWLDLMHLFAALSSFSSAVDGNGGTVRLGITGNDRNISQFLPGLGRVVGRAPSATGINPRWLGYATNPPYRPDAPCSEQPLVDLGARSGPAPDFMSTGTGADRR